MEPDFTKPDERSKTIVNAEFSNYTRSFLPAAKRRSMDWRSSYQEYTSPYHDMNSRITKECYAANSVSRVLNCSGMITKIVNNYEYMSFNFGPTLLSWMEKKAPNVYRRILDADKVSIALQGGHGNALAQAYNHTILPLMDSEDARTQILWGIRDFRSRFGRDPEGMWLPETAVNETVADLLIEFGMRFIILSPWQASAFRINGDDQWIELNGAPIDTSRPYLINRPGGSIAAFFYNHSLASGISFENYLKSADELYIRIMNLQEEPAALYILQQTVKFTGITDLLVICVLQR